MGDDNKGPGDGPAPGQPMPLDQYQVSMAGAMPGGPPVQVSMAMSQSGLATLAPAPQHTMHGAPQIHMQVSIILK